MMPLQQYSFKSLKAQSQTCINLDDITNAAVSLSINIGSARLFTNADMESHESMEFNFFAVFQCSFTDIFKSASSI
jgi:hypothetical protein